MLKYFQGRITTVKAEMQNYTITICVLECSSGSAVAGVGLKTGLNKILMSLAAALKPADALCAIATNRGAL